MMLNQVAQFLYTSFFTFKPETTIHTGVLIISEVFCIKCQEQCFPTFSKHFINYGNYCYYAKGFGEVGYIRRNWVLPSYCPVISLGSSVTELKRTLA